MLVVTGRSTTIVQSLERLLPPDETIHRVDADLGALDVGGLRAAVPVLGDRYVFAAGCLPQKSALEHDESEIRRVIGINMVSVVAMCELVLSANPKARICVIGSESGYRGSHNMLYAAAKAGVHGYIETKRLEPGQQLVGVAPTIIEDSGMTHRRVDRTQLDLRRRAAPKRRFLLAEEVARLVYWLLYEDHGFVTNTVVRMDGRTR